jgi:serine phosphatase RsbU (regulator of sigma subunit)
MMFSIGSQVSQFVERRVAEAMVDRHQEERQAAGRIQQGLFPRRSPDVTGFQIGGRCVSALEVGGDCFDFIPVTVCRDEFLDVLVADASGHGMGAALLATEARAYVRALSMCCADVGTILTLVNHRLASDRDSEGFVTALLLQLEPRTGSVVYANAGHHPGYVLNKQGIVRHELSSTCCPLGISRTVEFATESGIFLQPGDLVLLFTDGAVEGCSAAGEPFGVQRLISIAHAHRRETIDGILDEIFQEITEFCEYGLLTDDVTVVLIKAEVIADVPETPASALSVVPLP